MLNVIRISISNLAYESGLPRCRYEPNHVHVLIYIYNSPIVLYLVA